MNFLVSSSLWAQSDCGSDDSKHCACGCGFSVGEPCTINGLPGRGVIIKRDGRRLTVAYRNGEKIERDQRDVNKI